MKKLFTTLLTSLVFTSSISQEISVEPFGVGGVNITTEITHAGDDRVFMARKSGAIRVTDSEGVTINNTFLNISSFVNNLGEMGLLGLAFAPDYQETGKFYVHYNDLDGKSVIARYTVSEDPNQANPDGTILLTIENSSIGHKGGTIRFGPDGYLWISIGDDGDWENGQNIHTLKGKILRIDVSGDSYTIPPDNPFVGIEAEDEIWAYGLRNPWKFSFNHETEEIWIGDVGSIHFEEINRSSTNEPGVNYGWNCYEGNHQYPNSGCDGTEEITFPYSFYEYGNGRCSIIGGYVYRGAGMPSLIGKYIFADYCSGEIGWIDDDANLIFTPTGLDAIFSVGEDFYGNLYVASINRVYKIIDETMGVEDQNKVNISIYPNPTKDFVNITSNKAIDEISIYTMDGKLIQTLKGNTTQIDISNFSNGIYIMTIQSGDIMKTQKIIKK
ncbi:PQQ-dependent sugar dehydrogenase [Moheibacter lacus]|uniref:PQQ-dependent sugar dehydrogenase n=1 Tax=Moheibacter lacus TaxID=2745851 RepID=A0A838ZTF2_9FLAO|nr:PQQ-dependent sugar dehydrogenase [Moheibacter lacus]MBA5630219.1 PQQ-dependent sugar dehydrogenase [Moheibacter lacus]